MARLVLQGQSLHIRSIQTGSLRSQHYKPVPHRRYIDNGHPLHGILSDYT